MIRFELSISDPRASGAVLHGCLRLTTDKQIYEIPFDSEFEGDLNRLYQAIDALAKHFIDFTGVFRDESTEIKNYHIWSLSGGRKKEILFRVYQFTPGESQKKLIFEYSAPWLAFILDFSKISEINASSGLRDILTAWNTLRKRKHKKPISMSRVFYSAQDVLFDLFNTVTYPVAISELYNSFYIGPIGKTLLRILRLRYKTIQLSINPALESLQITWRLYRFPFYAVKIDWPYFDDVFLKGENIELFRKKIPLFIIPKKAFARSGYADYAEDYAYYFGIYLYDSWFHNTQFW